MLSYSTPDVLPEVNKFSASNFAGQKLSFRKEFMAKHCLELGLNSDIPDLICHVLIGKAFTYLNRNSVSL